MDNNLELAKFYKDLSQEIINKSFLEETEEFRENIFTQIYIDSLCEAAEIEDGNIAYHEARGIKVNGYSLAEDETYIALFVSIYKNNPDVYSVPPSEVLTMVNRAKNFYLKSMNKYHLEVEEAYGVFDLAKTIYDYRDRINEVKIIVMTNGTVRKMNFPPIEENGISFMASVWDVERIYRVLTSGSAREKIEIDLKSLTGKALSAIKINVPECKEYDVDGNSFISGGYTTYLTIIPGDVLFTIYKAYDARLLEKNVRAFLQVRGNVNKGIKSTITNTPEMFLAYNNGISATAESVSLRDETDDHCVITGLKDFQIVNGGQTTASIYNACIKNQQPLDKIFVQAKITVLNNQDQMDVVVPQISACANTQNKVQLADFSANDEFHQAIERLSRTVWAPAKTGGEQQTKWFYERARGQYADIRSREKSTKYFDSIYPKSQYFDKLDLGRYENAWEQLPHITSKGGQASFRDFTLRLKERGKFEPDQDYYQKLIAKTILYRKVRKIVKSQRFQGFWANIADYTVAYISYISGQRIDLQKIWRNQDTTEAFDKQAENVANAVYNYLIYECTGMNVTQWCKKEKCWNAIRENLNVDLSSELEKELIHLGKRTATSVSQGIYSANSKDKLLIEAIQKVDSSIWFGISSWGKQTGNLQSFQNGIAYTLGKYVYSHKEPSRKQANQGLVILQIAVRKGFITNDIVKDIVKRFCNLLL